MTAGDGWGMRVGVVCRAVAALLVALAFQLVAIGGTAAAQPTAATAAAADVAPFTDDPLVAGVTPVRAAHFEELRHPWVRVGGRSPGRGSWEQTMEVFISPAITGRSCFASFAES